MKKKLLLLFSVFVSFLGYSQTEVYFKYDEAGNQRYRGTNANGKSAPEEPPKQEEVPVLPVGEELIASDSKTMDEESFWKQMRLYPVPVNDIFTIDWTDEVDQLIETVSLYQYSSLNWKFHQQNLPNLNKQLKINMTGYDWGVYILQVTQKDGRVFSRKIIKR